MKNYVIEQSYIHGHRMVFGKKKEPVSSSILYFGTPEAIYCWFALFSIILTTLVLQMILKSMSVECNKTDMDNYAAEVDEEDSGKFTFLQFCSVRKNTLYLILVQFPSRYIQGQLNVPGKGIKLSNFVSSPLIDWELFISCGNDWSKTSPSCAHLP